MTVTLKGVSRERLFRGDFREDCISLYWQIKLYVARQIFVTFKLLAFSWILVEPRYESRHDLASGRALQYS
jgi:hypothetical protein